MLPRCRSWGTAPRFRPGWAGCPVPMRTEVLVWPRAITSVTSGRSAIACMSGPESLAAASTSMSPTVSRNRRSEPACSQRSQPGTALIAATTRWATADATSSGTRWPRLAASSMPCRSLSSLRGPNPFRSRSRPSPMACDSPATEPMPSSVYSCMARFGPSAGILVSSLTPSGMLARRSSSRAIVPVRWYSVIVCAIEVPTPGIASSPVRSRPSMSRPYPATNLAAFS